MRRPEEGRGGECVEISRLRLVPCYGESAKWCRVIPRLDILLIVTDVTHHHDAVAQAAHAMMTYAELCTAHVSMTYLEQHAAHVIMTDVAAGRENGVLSCRCVYHLLTLHTASHTPLIFCNSDELRARARCMHSAAPLLSAFQ